MTRVVLIAAVVLATWGFIAHPWDTLLIVYGVALMVVFATLGWFAWWAWVLAAEKERLE